MNRVPRVLTLIDTYAVGGPGKLILQFLANGGAKVCEPVVAGFRRGPERGWEFREEVEKLGIPFEVLRQRFAFDPSAIAAALRVARERKIDLVETHGYKAHLVGLALRKMAGIPWIAYSHGWTRENFKVELYNRLDRWIVRFADRIVPVARDVEDRLELGPGHARKVVAIPNAAEPPAAAGQSDIRREFGLDPGDPLLCVVGRLSPEKGHRHFIDAFKRLKDAYPAAKALLVGEGQERSALEAAIAAHGLEHRIILAGYRQDVSAFYHACDLVVVPSLREGMPMAVLEAMMHGRPVVATRVGGIPEVVVDGATGFLVPAADPVALAEGISRLLESPETIALMGSAGRNRAEEAFSFRERIARIASLYRSVLEKRGRGCECRG